MRRVVLPLVGLAAVACLWFASPLPTVAGGVALAGEWKARDGRRVVQGAPYRYRLRVTNPGPGAVTASFAFDLHRAGTPDARIPFDRWTGSIAAGSTVTIKGAVAPAQWFAGIGRYVIDVRTNHDIPSVAFKVTKPMVRVPRFEDVTAPSGLETLHQAPIECDGYSAGAAWADIEGDGDLDLYLPQQAGPSRMYVNEGGRFSDEATARGVDNGGAAGIAALFADYDNDADQDLYVVNDGRNRLYQNDGAGKFTDVAEAAGVAENGPGSSASWGDYDNDGHLDLYVTNWARCEVGGGYDYFDDALFHNEGDGTFTDRTALLNRTGSTAGAGFQAAWFDYDRDGDQDLYLANDYGGPAPEPNFLWRNDGRDGSGWKFTNVSVTSGTGLAINTMGIGVGDYDRDGDFDLALSNIEATALLKNRGDGTFVNVARRARVARPEQRVREKSITWGLAFYDLNRDGWEDLYVAGGSLAQENYPEAQPNATFVNSRDGRFLDLSAPSAADDDGVGRGVAFADFDRDGRMDLFLVNQGGFPRLFRNVTRGGHWLQVELTGRQSNRDGCGAILKARLSRRTELLREVFCGSVSLGSGHDHAVHFGLGARTEVRRLTIRWPSGTRQVIKNVRADRLIESVEPL
jgi:hypothetical protein